MPERPDPTGDRIVLNPQNLRGLAHPLRLKLLGLLRSDGPSTATRLAQRLGESSGATSYHLRQLAAYGFVVEDTARRGTGRERWWRSSARYTELPRVTERDAPAETEGFLRALADDCYQEMQAFLDELPSLPPAWERGWGIGDRLFRLTPGEAEQLRHEVTELFTRYRENEPEGEPGYAPPDAERVVVQVQILPRVSAEGAST